MRRERRRRVARALAFAWVLTAGPVRALAPETSPEAPDSITAVETTEAIPGTETAGTLEVAGSLAASGGCATRVSCGYGCTAELVTGICIIAVEWTGGVGVGDIRIGPRIHVECDICECWYIYSNDASNRLFKRTTKLSCGGEVVGVETYLE